MLKHTLACAAVVASLCALTANADEVQPKAGVFFGAKGGIADTDFPKGDQTRTITTSGTPSSYTTSIQNERFAGNVHIGNLWETSKLFYFGAQIGFTYWGSYDLNGAGSTSGNVGANQQTINLLLAGQFNLPANIFVGVRGGVGFNASNVSGTMSKSGAPNQTASARHKAAPIIGLSIGYNFNPAFQVSLNADRLMADDYKQSYLGFSQRMIRSTMYSIGIDYNIGQ